MSLANDDWQSIFAQCTAHDDLLHSSVESGDGLFADLDLDLNVDPDPDTYLDTFAGTPSMSFGAFPDLCSGSIPCVESNRFDDHDEPTLDCSTLPDPSTPLLAVPASHSLHNNCDTIPSLAPHPPTSCVSRRNGGSYDGDGPELPRMSGSVLKANKDAGMSVCRMLQCACALRPQNQLILAIICSRLVAWYRAMIHACFINGRSSSSGHSVNSASNQGPASLEKVAHQPVTIGDHSVDDQAMGLSIQAQVTLRELQHMQRLIETLSARMRESNNSYPKVMQGCGAEAGFPSAGLPGITRDRLVAHLSKEVHETKADLMTALVTP
ncbi:hypothetical protein N7530_010128 [Penicillium desertorum]|uniref:Aflatoxin regulatory protein domain-containing protein n=1 Tax=Penicillium desertorum TaxID=1303715 RepID=A0A9W9WKE6_9EURO|nr:hypothetical protein N7530_010128 [Penicillium desertorum]